VLLYLAVTTGTALAHSAVEAALFFYGAFILAFHYANFYRRESRWKIAFETWVMIAFITWTLWFTGGLTSPLLNLYLVVVITSALALGKLATLLEMGLIAACYLLLAAAGKPWSAWTVGYAVGLATQLAPVLLVAYVTTMFSVDIRYGLNRVKKLSETDDLTGVLNVRGLSVVFDRAFAHAARYTRPLGLLMIDCDNLKAVNDRYGHDAGNELLKQIARSIQHELRTTDIVARYGGDEFVAVLPETERDQARDVAQRIVEAVAHQPLLFRGDMIAIGVSVGVASYPLDGRTIDNLMLRADSAMYRAKQSGRGRVASVSD
jgi:diguanylate cyclase (GGDEF)-like protein